MAKIILDIFLILLFIAVGSLQVYVIYRIKDLKSNYNQFIDSQREFVGFIEKARQSLMLVNSQATDVLPELKKCIEDSESLMQDFSFVLARANKKIDVLQEMSALTEKEKQQQQQQLNSEPEKVVEEPKQENKGNNPYQVQNSTIANDSSSEFSEDPVLARLARLEQQDEESQDFLKTDNKRALQQQELIEKALKEIL